MQREIRVHSVRCCARRSGAWTPSGPQLVPKGHVRPASSKWILCLTPGASQCGRPARWGHREGPQTLRADVSRTRSASASWGLSAAKAMDDRKARNVRPSRARRPTHLEQPVAPLGAGRPACSRAARPAADRSRPAAVQAGPVTGPTPAAMAQWRAAFHDAVPHGHVSERPQARRLPIAATARRPLERSATAAVPAAASRGCLLRPPERRRVSRTSPPGCRPIMSSRPRPDRPAGRAGAAGRGRCSPGRGRCRG